LRRKIHLAILLERWAEFPISFQEEVQMATFCHSKQAGSVQVQSRSGSRKRARARDRETVGTPHGVIHPRVQKVGPDHFGIVAVDCAKARSKWMFADFYGNVLVAPIEVEHNQLAFAAAVTRLRDAIARHQIADLIVAVERTGRYHDVPQRAFRDAGFETRVVHPFTSKQYRQPADPDNKTDDTDLAAILRAGAGGFALVEPEWDESERELQLVVRQRRDLVEKCAALQCQVREHLDAALPGYAGCFDKLWESPVALPLARHATSAAAMRALGHDAIVRWLRERKLRFFDRTIDRVLAWAARAAAPDQAAARHAAIAWALDDDRVRKSLEIQALERDLAARVARTPYILLLSFPGVNIVSAADCAGEFGPILFYTSGRAITGRAGRPGCVLIRALEPVAGTRAMARRRGVPADSVSLTNGTGKLAEALGITLCDNGVDLARGPLGIGPPDAPREFSVGVGPRVGITRATALPIRFWIRRNCYVSRRR
jgi:transposase